MLRAYFGKTRKKQVSKKRMKNMYFSIFMKKRKDFGSKKKIDCVYLYYIIYILVYILVVASAGTRPPLSLTQGGGTNH